MKKYLATSVLVLSIVLPSLSLAQSASSASPCTMIGVNLRYGLSDTSTSGNGPVSRLQIFLSKGSYLNSPPTGYFGSLTRAAVAAFQTANGISATPPGFVGPLTRATIQNLSCATATGTASVTATSTPVSIVSTSTVPSITVTSPTNNSAFKDGNTITVQWNTTGISATSSVTIFLIGQGYSQVLADVPNSGSASVVIPALAATAFNPYIIQVQASGVEQTFSSSATNLTVLPQNPYPIIITAPAGGETIPENSNAALGYPIRFILTNSAALSPTASLTVSLDGGPTPGIVSRAVAGSLATILQNNQVIEGFSTVQNSSSTTELVGPGSYQVHLRLYNDLNDTQLMAEGISNPFTLTAGTNANSQLLIVTPTFLATTTASRNQANIDLLDAGISLNAGSAQISGIHFFDLSPNSRTNLAGLGLYEGTSTYLGAPASVTSLNNETYTNATEYQFNLPAGFTITAGQTASFSVRGNVSSSATGTIQMGVEGVAYPSGGVADIGSGGDTGVPITIQ